MQIHQLLDTIIKGIVEKQGLLDDGTITEQSTLEYDCEMDSLERFEFCMDIEKDYCITIPDKIAEGFKTIGEVVDYLVSVKVATI